MVPQPRPGSSLRLTAKVGDFGLSEAIDAGFSHMSQRFAGTPFYIAPETQVGRRGVADWLAGLVVGRRLFGYSVVIRSIGWLFGWSVG